ncbi:GntR family transcriptional regulator [Eubacterium sp. 1001713B170207_170306_E7]|uniref:GntR family transcriptional regulator n=1 Tax=Eubacterium sp. 1001713B170207_170306_E7 TaxID=2787097 RepID=UPI00189AA982|nr:GntR family transcriptional regulator [Eubacterium sp. 1001713B170207_170306_E7]
METKLYKGVQNDLKKKIERGVYPEGYKLESENSLCAQYNVSKVTLRKALSNLIEENYIESRPRVGYFVKAAERGVYHFSYSLSNVLNTYISAEEILDAAFGERDGVNVFEMTRRYANDDDEWIALEQVRIAFRHTLPGEKNTEKTRAYYRTHAEDILSLAETKKMTLEVSVDNEAVCDALEIFSDEVLLKVSEQYYDEYGKLFAEVRVYVPSDFAEVRACNKRKESNI